jgi:signal transduction histidine kinase
MILMFRFLTTILILSAIVCPCRAGSPALTTVAEIFAQRDLSANNTCALSLTGVVTLVDASRNMIVLQDATGAVALHPDSLGFSVRAGQRVSLKASACAPYVAGLPEFPFQPTGRDIRALFEAAANEGDFRLTRMRGWLQPPVTGNYTFWIASDDSSELSLSAGTDPARARRIAFVAGFTDPRDWSRFPSQRSETQFLEAGKSYYIEALQEQGTNASHLAVAWEGPTLKRSVIEGRYVVPWREAAEVPPAGLDSGTAQGISREFWTDYSVGSLEALKAKNAAEVRLTVHEMQIAILADGVRPDPQPFDPGQELAVEDDYRWVEGEGSVKFLATDGRSATLELAVGGNRVLVRVARWQGNLPSLRPHLRARFRGVREGVRDATEHLKTGLIWAPSELDVSFFDKPGESPQGLEPPLIDPVVAGLGYFFTRGVVTFNDRVRDKECIFIQDAQNGMFVSLAERELRAQLQVGQAVEIAGPLLPGKYASGIRPTTVKMIGWQNLPPPVIPSAEAPASSYRDSQWTEIEGVARAVNADGTVLVMGKRVPLLVWVGRTDREGLENLVNSTLRLRGVMSLELFGSPALLVPSREFIGVVEPGPELSPKPVPVNSLIGSGSENGWPHQVKVAGTVIYRSDRYFYLQDESGGIRVELHNEPPSRVGTTVEAVGFPGTRNSAPRLTDTTWRSLEPGQPVVPATLDPDNPDAACNGMLVTIEARLLGSKTRGADQILELQAHHHVFEAVLENPANKMQPGATGSVLRVTGVCVLETTSSSAALAQVLLRTPLDAALLQGPPWWTWQRSATALGLLLTILAASLLRIDFLKRRFARQQASRLEFARGMLESQETERRRIAASLHDSLGQNLLVIRSQTHLALQSIGDQSGVRQRLEGISDTTAQALNEVREITHDLRPYQLDRLGLTQSIRAITRKVSESHSISFACHVDEIDGIFNSNSEIHVYRIIQEGINNIVKHSGATEATVVLKITPEALSISIRDNGRGFSAGGATSDGGFGISGIRERAEIMGGAARIDSSPGQGVNLQVQLPLQSLTK